MFISQLKSKLAAYDKFGEQRINGLKGLFVLELLFIFNFYYGVTNPYFYYFYVPLTSFVAEIAGGTLEEKYLFLFITLAGSTISIFLFGLLSEYKIFFIFFVFFYTLLLYYVAIYRQKGLFIALPIILSLAAYSLIYENGSNNLYIALNHALQTIVASLIIFAGLYVFPKTYYLGIWRRAFIDVLVHLEALSGQICSGEVKTIPIFVGIIVMERYSKMLTKKSGAYYSVLKITLLSFELIMAMSYLASFRKQFRVEYVVLLHQYLAIVLDACKKGQTITLTPQDVTLLKQTPELQTLRQLILSWNCLCANL